MTFKDSNYNNKINKHPTHHQYINHLNIRQNHKFNQIFNKIKYIPNSNNQYMFNK